MPRQVVELHVRKSGDGVVIKGMTRSDRGTKYVLKNVRLDYKGLDKAARHAKMKAAIEKLMATT